MAGCCPASRVFTTEATKSANSAVRVSGPCWVRRATMARAIRWQSVPRRTRAPLRQWRGLRRQPANPGHAVLGVGSMRMSSGHQEAKTETALRRINLRRADAQVHQKMPSALPAAEVGQVAKALVADGKSGVCKGGPSRQSLRGLCRKRATGLQAPKRCSRCREWPPRPAGIDPQAYQAVAAGQRARR